jgi:RHS repeat-associated protein
MSGDALTLGGGGLSAINSFDAYGYNLFKLPITLGASQTWSLYQQQVGLEGGLTGPSASLAVNLGGRGSLAIDSQVEVGPVTIEGSDGNLTGRGAYSNGSLQIGTGALNATDGSSVKLIDAELEVTPNEQIEKSIKPATFGTGQVTAPAVGSLTSSGGLLYLEQPLAVAGGVTLDSASDLELIVSRAGSNGELSASGSVDLGNAALSLTDYECGELTPGEVRTLVTTTGNLTGTFSHIPNGGTTETLARDCGRSSLVRITYTAHSVVATVIGGEPDGGAPLLAELLAGWRNPSEFCPLCFLGKLISFVLPVDGPTGNFWHTFDDIGVPGRGIPLDLTRTYNSMSAATDGPFGFGWSFPYDMSLSFPDSTHVVVNQENGSQVTFAEQSGGTYTAPPRVTATLVHNGDGSWTFVRRHNDTFSFDSSGRLTQESDLNGYLTALAYNGAGQLETVTDPAGRKLTFAYTGSHIASVTDPLGRVVRYGYDGAGDLTDVTDVNGGNTHFTYDSAHRMLTMRMPNQAPGVPGSTGAVVTNVYDGEGQVIEQTDQLGRTTKFAYSGEPLGASGGTTTITDPKGNVTVQDYRFGELLSETEGYGTPQAATWTFGYDPATLGMTSVTDPNGHTTTSTFDAEGNVLTSTDALGRTTTNTYDSLNDLLTRTDPLGVTTTMTYDAHGNPLSSSRPLTGTPEVQRTTYTYGDSGHPGDVTAMTDPEGNTWKYTYDAYGDRNSATDPVGDKSTSTYNTIGWLLSTTSPRGNVEGANPAGFTTTYAHNNFGQVTETVDPLGHRTTDEYDPDQNLIASTDANGNVTRYAYDAADEQTAARRADGTTPQTTYWPDGTVKEQIDGAGHVTRYEYDSLGLVVAVTDPLGRTTRYGYDAVGNRTTVTDPEGRVTTTSYDAANEPTGIAYSDGKTPNVTGISYDADGERTGMTDGTGTWSWKWDSLHGLTRVVEGTNATVSYQYDLRNDPTAITYPNGKTVTRGYDAAGRWISVTDWLGNTTTFGYDPDGNPTTETLPGESGITDSSTYAADDTLSSISDKRGSSTLFAADYARDANGQLTSDSSQPASEGGYGYTALNQLCYAGSSATSCSSPPSGATQYQYDSADNLVRMGTTTQTFDAAGELTSTSTPSGGGKVGEGGEPEGTTHGQSGEAVTTGGGPRARGGTLAFTEERVLPSVTSGKVTFAHTAGRDGALSQLISTRGTGDLVLAFVSMKAPRGGGQGPARIRGGGLKWRAVTSASLAGGYISIWQARAHKRLTRVRVSVKLRRGGPSALAVVGFDSGAAVVNGARASRASGAVRVSATVPADAVVWALGQDAARHAKLRPLQGQALITKAHAPGSALSWLQSGAPPTAGQLVIGDATPRSSRWALGTVTIKEGTAVAAQAARLSTPPLEAGLASGDSAPLAPLALPPRAAAGVTPLASPANETVTFSYDAEGDRTGLLASNGASQSYAYNQALELTGVGGEVSYAYNGDGLRMSKTVGGMTTPFTWDLSNELPLLLEDGTNAYVYGPGGLPLEQVSGSTALWFHHDQLGSTRLLTDTTGNTVGTYAYTPYGSLATASGTASTPLLYTGQYYDTESGMYYLRARYYDPKTAQFISVDPALSTTGSPYSYVAGDPLSATDPSGLMNCHYVANESGGGSVCTRGVENNNDYPCSALAAATQDFHDQCERVVHYCRGDYDQGDPNVDNNPTDLWCGEAISEAQSTLTAAATNRDSQWILADLQKTIDIGNNEQAHQEHLCTILQSGCQGFISPDVAGACVNVLKTILDPLGIFLKPAPLSADNS